MCIGSPSLLLPVSRFQQRVVEAVFGLQWWEAIRRKHAQVRRELKEQRRLQDLGTVIQEEDTDAEKVERLCKRVPYVKECTAFVQPGEKQTQTVVVVLIVLQQGPVMEFARKQNYQVSSSSSVSHGGSDSFLRRKTYLKWLGASGFGSQFIVRYWLSSKGTRWENALFGLHEGEVLMGKYS